MRNQLHVLERQATSRTRDLQIAAEVSRQAAAITDLDDLLHRVVNLTKANFDLYHAQIYLMDAAGHTLGLAAGSGDIGHALKERGHRIALDSHGLVALAARNREAVIINDTHNHPDFLPNDLLPDTLSEMVIPLVVGQHLIGVLDMQADAIDRFDASDVGVHNTLAGQVAIAVQNAQAFEQLRATRRQEQLVAEINAAFAEAADEDAILAAVAPLVERYRCTSSLLTYYLEYDEQGEPTASLMRAARSGDGQSIPVDGLPYQYQRRDETPLLQTVLSNPTGLLVIEDMRTEARVDDESRQYIVQSGTLALIALPLHFNNRWQGAITFGWSEPQTFDAELLGLLRSLMLTASASVANRRAFVETQTAEQRAQWLARELQQVAELSTAAATIQDLDEMLPTIVDKTRDAFGLYHTQIYLLDEAGRNVVLAAGSGEAGRRMLKRGHQISLERGASVVANVVHQRAPVIANEALKSPDFLPNPMLPGTRAEMAIPMFVGDTLIGVLDVQSKQVNRFQIEDVQIKSTLAAQIAIAVQNARAYEAEQSVRSSLQERIKELSALQEVGAYGDEDLPLAEYLAKVVRRLPGSMQYPDVCVAGIELYETIYGDAEALTTPWKLTAPLILEGEQAGTLAIGYTEERDFLLEETPHINSIARRINAYTQRQQAEVRVQRLARELQTVADLTTATSTILDVDELMQSVVDKARADFDLYHAHIYLLDERRRTLMLAAGAGEPGRRMKASGHRIALDAPHSLVARAARERSGVVANNAQQKEDFLPNPLLPNTKSEIASPMMVGNTLLGIFDVQSEVRDRFTERDIRVYETLAAQIAVAVQNARTFVDVETARHNAEQLAAVNAALSQANDEQGILNAIAGLFSRYNPSLGVIGYFYSTNGEQTPDVYDIRAAQTGDGQPYPLENFPELQMTIDKYPAINRVFSNPDGMLISGDVQNDPQTDPASREYFKATNIAGVITVGLRTATTWHGAISLTWAEPVNFTDEILDQLRAILPTATAV
ncbi:MAG: GAF domain-containing protein, partial [Chloroflexi bacterium]|nr:GAF domain-containing protein [Chloroflexota bacterium]